ncbi:hypothetical protein COOONC_08546, partial [Cooperia oncophora]
VHRRYSTTGSNTELHLLSASELEDTVANVVSQFLHLPVPKDQAEPQPTTEARRPIIKEPEEGGKALNGILGKNLVPRLQKLRVLDKMIGERTALVERFDANLVKQEIARKRAFILKCRMAKDGKTREVATQFEKKTSSSDSSTTSESAGTTSESSEESEESEETDESQATSTEESSASESRTSSSRETILRKNSSAVPVGKHSPKKDDRDTEEPPTVPSPTSLYLKQLREKILKERMEKI